MDTKDNGYHDAENEVDPDSDDDPERVLSGKMSESSGYAGSDLYNYKVLSLSLSLHLPVLVLVKFFQHVILQQEVKLYGFPPTDSQQSG